MRTKLDELESIRGVAALLVVVLHLPKWAGVFDVPQVDNFALMVDLFFVLSGFVIFRAYGDQLHTLGDAARFQFLRLGRLYPAHFIFLVAYLALEFARLYASHGMTLAQAPFSQNTAARFVQNMFLVQALAPHPELSFNTPAWSISVEFWTYILFALIVLLARRWALLVFAAFATCAGIALALGDTAGMDTVLRCWCGFFVGCLTARLYTNRLSTIKLPTIAPWVSIAGLSSYIWLRTPGTVGVMIYPLSAGLIIAVLCTPDGVVRRALNHRFAVRLGTWSYSIYMAHHFLITIFEIALNRVLHMPAGTKPSGGYIAVMTPTKAAFAYVAFFAILLALSAALYRWVEDPLRTRARRAVAPRTPTTPPDVAIA